MCSHGDGGCWQGQGGDEDQDEGGRRERITMSVPTETMNMKELHARNGEDDHDDDDDDHGSIEGSRPYGGPYGGEGGIAQQ